VKKDVDRCTYGPSLRVGLIQEMTTETKNRKTISFRLDRAFLKKLRNIAAATGHTMTACLESSADLGFKSYLAKVEREQKAAKKRLDKSP